MSGMESFRFSKDQDLEQLIYPSHSVVDQEASAVPVRGPDELCNGKSWKISGKYGDQISLCLRVVDGLVSVELKGGSPWAAHGSTGPARHSYWVVGSFNNWSPEQMIPADSPGTFAYRGRATWRLETVLLCLRRGAACSRSASTSS